MALKKVVKGNAEMKWKDVGEPIDSQFLDVYTRCVMVLTLWPILGVIFSTVRKNPQSGKSARVLDIKPGSLCIVIGTIYMEMRLKPNILEDIAREVCCDTDLPFNCS